MTDTVITEQVGRILITTLNRPQVHNAIDGEAARGLARALDELDENDSISVGILTGAGHTFCAGMDLKAFLTGDTPEIPGRGLGGLTERPPRKPLIAAVEGWALAGGLELMLACDMVVAGEDAKFGVPEVKRALVAGGGGALRLPKLIPPAFAMELLLTGEPIDAARAAAMGLVNRVVPTGEALDTARELAAVIAGNGPLAVAATKEIARRTSDWTEKEGWVEQRRLMETVNNSSDAKEGALAFTERRHPQWRGE
ncbi:crotonase/enoyl-CoA hydratase family protein [Rhodococcus wratislaviensis]|uniref:Enoyl-CoA hydratase n=1 Tax=Rhodococcus wratislaviensis NBRC 100605 TaxID=1219028 RepID=X0QYG4_RHOWR|nr:crotonase/enoyl-CoA hydratase family protein [Rhodococcus wratislaviensis]GAF43655.1 enoyl-CoA hydratase [Rhodococcus wratislaviensis NBRC 100605]